MVRQNNLFKSNANTQFNFLDKLDLDQDVKERLSINLNRTLKGSNEVYVTPIGKEHGTENILAKWDKVFQANKSRINDVLLTIEEAQRSKYGPRSIAVPWSERKAGLLEYYKPYSGKDISSIDCRPQATRDIGKLRPLDVQTASKYLKNSTNSGLPFYTKKGIVKDRLLNRFEFYLNRKDPCVLFTRTTEQRKTRNVWGYPMADTLNEMRFFVPLLGYERRLSWRAALNGPDAVNIQMTRMIKSAISLGLILIPIDFVACDSCIKKKLQYLANLRYKYLFQTRSHKDLDYILERKSKIGIVTPEGTETGFNAEPSGATLTNVDVSNVCEIIAKHSGCLEGDLYQIQGDDGVFAIKEEKLSSFLNNFMSYGFKLNPKTKLEYSSKYVVYLQNLYHMDYMKDGVIGGIYPVYRALNRIIFQERWSNFEDYGITGKDYYAIRSISILENCKFHPLFEELVKFVLKYDKYQLRPSHRGISEYVKFISDSSGIEGILINQHGDNIKGFNNFETVKLINKLRGA